MANNYADLSTSLVATAPSPATTGTSLVVTAGHGARFPTAPFYATAHPDGVFPTFDNAEIVQVTGKSTDTLTIVRAQKSTTAKSIAIGWRISASIYAADLPGRLENVYTYTYDGTDIFINGVDQNNGDNTVDWTKPTGLKFIIVEVQGGGGGGGAGGLSANLIGVGAGGGAGAYAMSKIAVGDLGSTEVVTVGAAGAGGTTGVGGNGGSSSFGAHAVAGGGVAGYWRSNVGYSVNAGTSAGGTATAGDIQVGGQPGEPAQAISSSVMRSGGGGSSRFGGGGLWVTTNGAGDFSGNPATGYGAGGGGGVNDDNGTASAGGAGSAGIVIIYEYFN